jgi:hypothetical protein
LSLRDIVSETVRGAALRCKLPEPVSNIAFVPVGDMRAATSSNSAKNPQCISVGFFARISRFASHLVNLARKPFLRLVPARSGNLAIV